MGFEATLHPFLVTHQPANPDPCAPPFVDPAMNVLGPIVLIFAQCLFVDYLSGPQGLWATPWSHTCRAGPCAAHIHYASSLSPAAIAAIATIASIASAGTGRRSEGRPSNSNRVVGRAAVERRCRVRTSDSFDSTTELSLQQTF